MEKLINPYDKECMRMAILKHEEIFKEQVYELHRLYHIQKLLMNSSIGNSRPKGNKRENWDLQNELHRKLDLEQPAEAAEELEVIDESEIELTLGPTRYSKNRRKKSEAQLTSDSGLSFSSSSTGSSYVNRTSSRTRYQRRSKEQLGGCEEQLRQDERLKMPPWFFQVLSLNMT
ncbi:PREDICTED: uncharacterized protein LOC101308414 [Fragaria vesca subsp. vesca]|uniref:uncharacterized protein LOC101308414 n=1 Tax=Fragaria vesca subsp. vesca TaxID=101020 RepID=UPI0002C32CCE|nr:PREDICTED: uncharacterized protein LOC101308414 [Fragaria vesca subsp. vesca]XP_011468072.1 PREDICTED: uncharacterized protein LOC101308414 [Fragaria vesca subsp. vesca]